MEMLKERLADAQWTAHLGSLIVCGPVLAQF